MTYLGSRLSLQGSTVKRELAGRHSTGLNAPATLTWQSWSKEARWWSTSCTETNSRAQEQCCSDGSCDISLRRLSVSSLGEDSLWMLGWLGMSMHERALSQAEHHTLTKKTTVPFCTCSSAVQARRESGEPGEPWSPWSSLVTGLLDVRPATQR